jgi:ubiquinone/menaquinone biosynthesis C-methylase UbiE
MVAKLSSLLLVLVFGCGRRDKDRAHPEGTSATAGPAVSVTSTSLHGAAAHDPAHPPIDCPLRKQGIDPGHMKPFEDTEKYIAFLERADRAVWQKPDAVVTALGLKGTETVVDIGAGSGYFAFRFAKALPKGKVIATDTEAEMVRHLHHKAMTEGITNLEVRMIQADDPTVPEGSDWVFVCDVLHHVSDRVAWLSKAAKPLKPGAKLALIEFKEGKLPEGPPETMKIPRAELVSVATQAGLALKSEHAELLPYQVFLVFEKR